MEYAQGSNKIRFCLRKSGLLGIMYLWLCVSSLVIAVLCFIFKDYSQSFLMLKDVSLYSVLLFGLFICKYKLNDMPVVSGVYVMIMLLLYCSSSSASALAKLSSVRQIISIYSFILLGYIFSNSINSVQKIYKWIMFTGILIVIFGYVERSMYFWQTGFLYDYFEAKSIPLFGNGYPVFFIEPTKAIIPEAIEIPGNGSVRMVSAFLDPINLGHSIVLWLCVLIYCKSFSVNKVFRYFLIILLSIALLLTYCKGAWLQLSLVLLILNEKLNHKFRIAICILSILAAPLIIYSHDGFMVHLLGFYSSLVSLSLFGHGIGLIGNYSSMLGESIDLGIGDSFVGALLGQLGIVGTCVWFLVLFVMLRSLSRHNFAKKVIIAQLAIAFVSENSFNLLSIAGIGLVLGLEMRESERFKVFNDTSFFP